MDLKEIKLLVDALESERQDSEDKDAKLMSEFLLPHRGFWPGASDSRLNILAKSKKVINPAATLSIERAAGGLTTGMTPEGQPWFGLKLRDKTLMDAAGVREHLEYRRKMINFVLRSGGFYQAIYLCNLELLGFPGMLLFADNNDETFVRFECCTFGTYAIALDSNGVLDTVVRRIRWSAIQLKKKFGEVNLSEGTKQLLTKNPYKKVDIVHVVVPRDTVQGKIDKLNMPYASVMFEDKGEKFLSESGYHEMPYFFAPYSRAGSSDYGLSPGHLLVWHTKQLNETERQKLIALQKVINPPMRKPAKYKGALNIQPGGENPISSNDPKGISPLYEVPVQGYQYALQEIQDVMLRIASVAKADLFYDLPSEMRPKDMTATEYMERKRERMQQIAPVIAIYEPSILDKVIERVHNVLDRLGYFQDMPAALLEADGLEIEYVSTVAKALRQVGAEATRVFMQDLKGIAEVEGMGGDKPDVLRKIDFAQAVDEIANGIGVPASIVRDDETYKKLIEADRKAEQAAAEQQQQLAAMESAAKLGNVKKDGTVLGEALNEQQQ